MNDLTDMTIERMAALYTSQIDNLQTQVKLLNQEILNRDYMYCKHLETCIETAITQINKIITDIQLSGTQNETLYGKVLSQLYNVLIGLDTVSQEQFEKTLQRYLSTTKEYNS